MHRIVIVRTCGIAILLALELGDGRRIGAESGQLLQQGRRRLGVGVDFLHNWVFDTARQLPSGSRHTVAHVVRGLLNIP